jgi:hypothetical protein
MHELLLIIDWLVNDAGLWHAVLGVLVAAFFAWVMRLGKRLRSIEASQTSIEKSQAATANHLNTATEGGLADVVAAINKNTKKNGVQ